MARIAGVNIPDNKLIKFSLTYIYGIGQRASQKILDDLHIDSAKRTNALTNEELSKLREEIENRYKVEGDLRHAVKMNIARLKEIGCYRGVRHQKGLPVRGQRTKTNTRTVRGNVRKTAGSGRRVESKT